MADLMALYKYQNYLAQTKNASFDLTFKPGAFIPCGGIYRCTGCGNEIATEGVGVFPDRDHHVHERRQGEIQWQLVAATVSNVPAPYLHGSG
jgi:hypothetical protein